MNAVILHSTVSHGIIRTNQETVAYEPGRPISNQIHMIRMEESPMNAQRASNQQNGNPDKGHSETMDELLGIILPEWKDNNDTDGTTDGSEQDIIEQEWSSDVTIVGDDDDTNDYWTVVQDVAWNLDDKAFTIINNHTAVPCTIAVNMSYMPNWLTFNVLTESHDRTPVVRTFQPRDFALFTLSQIQDWLHDSDYVTWFSVDEDIIMESDEHPSPYTAPVSLEFAESLNHMMKTGMLTVIR